MIIPAGKKIRINRTSYERSGDGGSYKSKGPVVNQPMVLEEDITLSLSSEFSPVWGEKGLGPGGFLGDIITSGLALITGSGYTGKFKQMGLQMWRSTDPISFGPTVSFYADKTNFNPREQVYEPIMTLCKIPLPSEGPGGILKSPGPTIINFLEGVEMANPDIYSLQIGSILYIDQIIIKKAEPTFSTETDQDGYPIWGKVQLDIQSINIATKEMVDQRLG